MRALDAITDAYERLNRLSPGESLSADDAAFGFRRLNLYVDELSAQNLFLYRDVLTSAAQTGDITLGAGAWAGVSPSAEVVSAMVDNVPLSPISVSQYNRKVRPIPIGLPYEFAPDGMASIYLYPTPSGQTIRLQTREGVKEFVDLTTDYTVPNGYANLLGAGLAVRLAPVLLGQIPQTLLRAETKAEGAVDKYMPAIVNVGSYQRSSTSGLAAVLYGSGSY